MDPSFQKPLADALRPSTLKEVAGQEHLLGEEGVLTRIIASAAPASLIFWGPPGTGKTTLARIYASAFGAVFEQLSAVLCNVADIRRVTEAALKRKTEEGGLLASVEPQRTVLFVDEIHRFNKAQQDAFLPYVEDGTLILVGATTENPSFSLNNALLSRVQVLTLNALDTQALEGVLTRAEGAYGPLPLTKGARSALIKLAHGDGRYLLTMAETLYKVEVKEPLTATALGTFLQERVAAFDRDGDGHYNTISALHKAVRGSDVDAALYWFARALEGGEDPLYIARRLIRMATEDIGLAAPQALNQCVSALKAYQVLGTPEGELALAQAVTFLAASPKSNRVYTAFKKAQKLAKNTHHLDPPKHILNAPTKMMREMGYAKGYIYEPDTPEGVSGQSFFPEGMNIDKNIPFYAPTENGYEKIIKAVLDEVNTLRKQQKGS